MMLTKAGLILGACLLVTATLGSTGDKDNANAKGQAAFKANCVSCHGSDGGGTPLGKSIHAPDLRSEEVQKKSHADLTQTITEGKANMPSFKRILDPQQVQAVVDYIRDLGKNRPPKQQ
jgi:mono/diheme cytochrome c family protein